MVRSGSKDYYKILGVSRNADPEAMKKAYRRLVKRYHPDRRPEDVSAEERFKEVQEAYQVLKDPGKRSQYDFGTQGRHSDGSSNRDAQGSTAKRGRRVSEVVEDVFEFIKSRMEDDGKRRGDDLRYHLILSFEEAANGVDKVIHIPKWKVCSRCLGRGWESPLKSPVCKVCRGEGEITVAIGRNRMMQECPGCDGKGILEKHTCNKCNGEKKIHYRVERNITIPPGVDNGSRLKIRGEGEKGEKGGDPGDLYIVIQIQDHPLFRREDLDVMCEIPIQFTLAAMGGEIKVPTLKGDKTLRIPPGTQSGHTFMLRGYGIPCLNGSKKGNQKVCVKVEVPRDLSAKQKKILQAFERSCPK